MMKLIGLLLLIPIFCLAESRPDTFIVSMMDRKVQVISPEKIRDIFSVVVENKSLSKLVAKFSTEEGTIKFISIESGKTETVEIKHNNGAKVFFVPLSPAFQEIELIVGKKEYEIPSQK